MTGRSFALVAGMRTDGTSYVRPSANRRAFSRYCRWAEASGSA